MCRVNCQSCKEPLANDQFIVDRESSCPREAPKTTSGSQSAESNQKSKLSLQRFLLLDLVEGPPEDPKAMCRRLVLLKLRRGHESDTDLSKRNEFKRRHLASELNQSRLHPSWPSCCCCQPASSPSPRSTSSCAPTAPRCAYPPSSLPFFPSPFAQQPPCRLRTAHS